MTIPKELSMYLDTTEFEQAIIQSQEPIKVKINHTEEDEADESDSEPSCDNFS